MTTKELFTQALNEATAVVDAVRPEDFTYQTPAKDWDVHTLAQHMLYELSWVADIVHGKTIQEVGTTYDVPLDNASLATRWHVAADAALAAIADADLQATAHLSGGDMPVDEYLQQVAFELLIHTWDLGQGITTEVRFTDEAAQAAYDYAAQRIEGWRQAGLFAAAVMVSDDSPVQTRLLALTGRLAKI